LSDPITFIAALAGTNSAAKWLTLGSDNDGKVVLEVPASELASLMRLTLLVKKSLRVTIEEGE
jgi:hypothetical protein